MTSLDGIPILRHAEDAGAACLRRRSRSEFSEDQLQRLLADHPELLPISSIETAWAGAVCVARELPTGAGPIDLLLANPAGRITIVETKLFSNPEARRKVLAQAIDYAAALHQMEYGDLSRAVGQARPDLRTAADPLLEAVRCGTDSYEEMDEAAFRHRVGTDLEVGQFLILIVGEGIRTELRTLVGFLDRVAHLGFQIGLIEIEHYESKPHELFVPRIVGQIEREARIWRPDPRSRAAHELATIAEQAQQARSATERPRMSEIEALQAYRSSLESFAGYGIVELMDRLLDAAQEVDLTIEQQPSGTSVIIYHIDPDLPASEKFNLLAFDKTGRLGWTDFLQFRCRRLGLDDAIWREHWEAIAAMTGAGRLEHAPSEKRPDNHRFVDESTKGPELVRLLGTDGRNTLGVVGILARTATRLREALAG